MPGRKRKAERSSQSRQQLDHVTVRPFRRSTDVPLRVLTAGDQVLAIIHAQPGRRNRLSKRYANRDRLDPGAPLPHRVARPFDGDRDDRGLGLQAMTKPPFLKGSRLPVRLRVPSGKIRNEFPSRKACGRPLDGGQALIAVAALERHEAGEVEGLRENRQLPELRLVEDPQPREQRRGASGRESAARRCWRD